MGDSHYPHVCPECAAACYIGGDQIVRCTNEACRHSDPDLSMGKLEADWEEDTEPQLFHVDFHGNKKWPV